MRIGLLKWTITWFNEGTEGVYVPKQLFEEATGRILDNCAVDKLFGLYDLPPAILFSKLCHKDNFGAVCAAILEFAIHIDLWSHQNTSTHTRKKTYKRPNFVPAGDQIQDRHLRQRFSGTNFKHIGQDLTSFCTRTLSVVVTTALYSSLERTGWPIERGRI
jgi:hypothetical protein